MHKFGFSIKLKFICSTLGFHLSVQFTCSKDLINILFWDYLPGFYQCYHLSDHISMFYYFPRFYHLSDHILMFYSSNLLSILLILGKKMPFFSESLIFFPKIATKRPNLSSFEALFSITCFFDVKITQNQHNRCNFQMTPWSLIHRLNVYL